MLLISVLTSAIFINSPSTSAKVIGVVACASKYALIVAKLASADSLSAFNSSFGSGFTIVVVIGEDDDVGIGDDVVVVVEDDDDVVVFVVGGDIIIIGRGEVVVFEIIGAVYCGEAVVLIIIGDDAEVVVAVKIGNEVDEDGDEAVVVVLIIIGDEGDDVVVEFVVLMFNDVETMIVFSSFSGSDSIVVSAPLCMVWLPSVFSLELKKDEFES